MIDVFMIGAQKAGTTSLYDWLSQHPDIEAPTAVKDYHYFTVDKYYIDQDARIDKYYSKDDRLKLHAAVNYLYFSEKAANRISRYNSKARIIACLREPRARAISAYKYFYRTGREARTFDQAVADEVYGRLHGQEAYANHTYIGHGKYTDQLRTFLNYFDQSQLLIMFFEDLLDEKSRAREMSRLCEFLGIDPMFKFKYTHHNASYEAILPGLRNRVQYVGNKYPLLKKIIPFACRRWIGKKIDELNISKRPISISISEITNQILNEELRDEVNRLSELLGIDINKKWGMSEL